MSHMNDPNVNQPNQYRDPAPTNEAAADHGYEAFVAFQEGSHLLATANHHAAATALERARNLEPDQGSIREALGRAYYSSGRVPAAQAEFTRAVEIDPVNDYAHFGLGLCLLKTGDRIGARRHLRLAVAMRPQPEYRDALARAVDGAA
jgi:Flp pilus assembly protein TadD